MSDDNNPLCLRCLLLGLLPVLAAGALGWWLSGAYEERLNAATIEVAAAVEENDDLRVQAEEMEITLAETQEQLQAARRAAATTGPVTTGEIRDRIAALNENDRRKLLAALGVGEAFGADALGAAIGEAPSAEQVRLYDRLPDFEGFSSWFSALNQDEKSEWLGRLPETDGLTISKVDLPELGLVDAATISQQFGLLQDQADTVAAERDQLRADLDAARLEQDESIEQNTALRQEVEQLKSALDAEADAPGATELLDAVGAISPTDRAEFLAAITRSDGFAGWVEGLSEEDQAQLRDRLALATPSDAPEEENASALRNEVDRLIGDLATALAERDALAEQYAALRDIADTPDAERLSLPGRGVVTVAEAQAAFSELDGVLADLRSAVESARVSVNEKEARIATLEEDLAAAQSTAEEAQREAEQARESLVGRLRESMETAETAPETDQTATVGSPVTLNANVAFATGSATLSDPGKDALARIAEELLSELDARPEQEWELVIEGHTDRRPIFTERYFSNWDLSAARAAAVARHLASLGVPEDRLIAVGRAQFQPIDEGDSEAAFARNRRIEFDIRSRQ
ncbi:MAG: OmpA family protein [Pseudomonadota bacterium]